MNDPLQVCRDLLRRSGSTFRHAIALLPAAHRDAMTVLYAFARVVDDLVDETPDREQARRGIAAWRERVSRLPGDPGEDPVARALGLVMARHGLSREPLMLLLDGMDQDLQGEPIETFGDLCLYCHRVAGSIGLATMEVLGLDREATRRYALLSGAFVQGINVLRDVGRDAAIGRIYLPRQDLHRFGVSPEDLLQRRQCPELRALLRFEAARIRALDDLATAAIPEDLRRHLAFPEALRGVYREVLGELERQDFPVFRPDPVRPRSHRLLFRALQYRPWTALLRR